MAREVSENCPIFLRMKRKVARPESSWYVPGCARSAVDTVVVHTLMELLFSKGDKYSSDSCTDTCTGGAQTSGVRERSLVH